MKLSEWAKSQGISYITAYRWFKLGQIPNAKQYGSGTIVVLQNNNIDLTNNKCYIYCRVSNHTRKQGLLDQVTRCEIFCQAKGLVVEKVYKEIASGMNDNRKQLKLLLDNNPKIIVVEHKDRLTRFGFNYLKLLLNKLNCQIIVINESSNNEDDLMTDLTSIITSFCCRLYGLRRTKNKLEQIKKIVND